MQQLPYALTHPHFNFYIFQRGTNYPFSNRCSPRATPHFPQLTSYHYHAPLHESPQPPHKYFPLQPS
ncbi:beta-galactosidase, partial [Staphylococcus pettenkoferi]|uniref:beta-galactosidase n=1 Tax=Staphylococcus pettenkoferi TaxID=170573 RepID=UPI003B8A893C